MTAVRAAAVMACTGVVVLAGCAQPPGGRSRERAAPEGGDGKSGAAPAPQVTPTPDPAAEPAPETVPAPGPAKPVDYLHMPVLPAVKNPPAGKYPLRWIYYSTNFQVNERIDELIATMKKAKGIGYNGVLITDYKFGSFRDRPRHYYANLERFASACREADMEIIPTVMTPSLLINDPMMAEGLPVRDQEFVVRNGKATVKNVANLLPNGGFERVKRGGAFADWDWIDSPGSTSFRDTELRHGGESSVRLENFRAKNRHGNARINKTLNLKPWHQYKVSVWIRTEKLSPCGGADPKIALLCEGGRNLTYRYLGVKATQDWTEHVITFNTLEHSRVRFYCGLWGGRSGKMWVDDLALTECGAVNLLRRDGCPVKVTSADGAVEYEEGRDFERWTDPKSGHSPWPGSFDDWHAPPPIVLAAGSRIRDGETVKVSYYHPVRIYWGAVFPCWLNDDLFTHARAQLENMEKYFRPRKYFMAHDEIRLAGWCETCRAHGTCGQILAAHVRRYVDLIREINADADIFVWSDMFDPFHNADKHPYYLCASSFKGSREGLDRSVVIANWHSGAREKNMPFFESLGMRQIVAVALNLGAQIVFVGGDRLGSGALPGIHVTGQRVGRLGRAVLNRADIPVAGLRQWPTVEVRFVQLAEVDPFPT